MISHRVPGIGALLGLSPRIDKEASQVWKIGLRMGQCTVSKAPNSRTDTMMSVNLYIARAKVVDYT